VTPVDKFEAGLIRRLQTEFDPHFETSPGVRRENLGFRRIETVGACPDNDAFERLGRDLETLGDLGWQRGAPRAVQLGARALKGADRLIVDGPESVRRCVGPAVGLKIEKECLGSVSTRRKLERALDLSLERGYAAPGFLIRGYVAVRRAEAAAAEQPVAASVRTSESGVDAQSPHCLAVTLPQAR
jgi:hypothetical protein